jgi:hypothetical protein
MSSAVVGHLPLEEYDLLEERLALFLGVDLTAPDMPSLPDEVPAEWAAVVRAQAEVDLYFFGRYVISSIRNYWDAGKRPVCHPFQYNSARLLEVEGWDRWVDVWSRAHWKSTWKTYILPLWNAIKHPGWCAGIVSVTKDLAEGNLGQIQAQIERNPILALLWPNIFPSDPKRQGVKPWSKEKGLQLLSWPDGRREQSFEAVGLDHPRTGAHFDVLYVDDLHDDRNQTTEEQIEKALRNHALLAGTTSATSYRTYSGTWYGGEEDVLRHLWAKQDVGRLRIRKCVEPVEDTRDYPAEERGLMTLLGGKPVFFTLEQLYQKYKDFGDPATYAEQMLLDPKKGMGCVFDSSKLRYYTTRPDQVRQNCTVYVLVDPAGTAGGRRTDPSALMVVGLGQDRNFYVLDLIKEQMDAVRRNQLIIALHQRWRPTWVLVEENQSTSDTVHLVEMMNRPEVNWRFDHQLKSVSPRRQVEGGSGAGGHKIQRLFSAFDSPLKEGRIYLPQELLQRGPDGRLRDRIKELVHEVDTFPLSSDDHWLASWALMFERHSGERSAPELRWPEPLPEGDYMRDPGLFDRLVQQALQNSGLVKDQDWLSW